ncbi:MAG TPA: arylsulfotransferase family protein, partial [Acidimicrobiales bacterium]|nr:arylsulfotransferase family protein [Acidimicrobiales bacterium]
MTSEPRAPADHLSYVTRPDLTPPGVSISTGAGFAGSGLESMYLFCALKPPIAANPGPLSTPTHIFPPGATQGLMILDTSGELVWFNPLPAADELPFNFRVQSYGGSPVLTWFQGTVAHGHAVAGHYVIADDTYTQVTEVYETAYPCDLHEFILTPEGTALHTAYEAGVPDGRGGTVIVGHAQEVDVATNELLFDWPCYPAVSRAMSYVGREADYFHINSIDVWPGTDRNLLISSRNTCAVYLVDRSTKEVIWQLGGKQSDFAMQHGTRFWYQHDARALPDGSGVSLFDDASQPCPETDASGKVLTLDQQARTAVLRHRYQHTDGELDTPSQGNCQLLPNACHLVGWGYLPWFSAYGLSGDAIGAPLILDGRFPDGSSSYRTFLFDWTGNPPLSELRLVVLPTGSSGQFVAFVSWNGATEVAAWQLEAGPSLGALDTVATFPKSGFETAFSFTLAGA